MRTKSVGVHQATLEVMYKNRNLGVLFTQHTFGIATALPYCDNPVPITLQSKRKRKDLTDVGPGRLFDLEKGGGSQALELHVPCRKCRKCLWIKARTYERKIMNELASTSSNAERSYFVTLTFRLSARAKLWTAATRLAGGQYPSRKQRARPVVSEVADFLRRVRERNKRINNGRLRYISVVEYHQSGDPHVHLVLSGSITSKTIRKASWPGGYIHIRRVPDGEHAYAAAYVAKYICKTADSVVTTSKRYGAWLPGTYRPKHDGGPMLRHDEDLLAMPAEGVSEGVVRDEHDQANPIENPPQETTWQQDWSEDYIRFWSEETLLRISLERSDDLECKHTPVQASLALHETGGAPSRLRFERPPLQLIETPKPEDATAPADTGTSGEAWDRPPTGKATQA